jgi:predicted glycoside hydrolase/deacetylase ChbG (UPF0249 family)
MSDLEAENATLRAQLADYRANLDTACAHHDEHHARQKQLEQIAQGLADVLRKTPCPLNEHHRALAKFDAYQQQKGT